MKWRCINAGLNTGGFNMAFDIYLANNCEPDEAFLRFYRWNPYCISLGANQKLSSIDERKAEADDIDVVVRPTGGRAILHSEELTYSVILPLSKISSVRNIYYEINLALADGLKQYDPALSLVELETTQPDFPSFYKEEKSAVCFAVPAKSELKFCGKKLVGSAQRKLDGTVLQHGSILCGDFHKKIVDYLTVSEENKSLIKSEMDNTTIDLKSILNKEIDYQLLFENLLSGFKKHFASEIEPVDLDELYSVDGELNNFS